MRFSNRKNTGTQQDSSDKVGNRRRLVFNATLLFGAFLALTAVVVWNLVLLGRQRCDPTAKETLTSLRMKITESESYYASVKEAKRHLHSGNIGKARDVLEEAVMRARTNNVLPYEIEVGPSEGEMLLMSIFNLTEPDGKKSRLMVQYLKKHYPEYDPRSYDWICERMLGN
jgi:hypothetical protein